MVHFNKTLKIGEENDPSKEKIGVTERPRSLSRGKAIAMAICSARIDAWRELTNWRQFFMRLSCFWS